MACIKSCSIDSRNEQSPTCEVVHETNKAHFRNLLLNRFLPSSVGKALAWRSGGPGFQSHWGQILTNFFALPRVKICQIIWQKRLSWKTQLCIRRRDVSVLIIFRLKFILNVIVSIPVIAFLFWWHLSNVKFYINFCSNLQRLADTTMAISWKTFLILLLVMEQWTAVTTNLYDPHVRPETGPFFEGW